jgi:hypothetical protein
LTNHKIVLADMGDLAANQIFKIVEDWTIAGLCDNSVWLDVKNPTQLFLTSVEGTKKLATNDWIGSVFRPGDSKNLFSLQVARDSKALLDFDAVEKTLSVHPELSSASAGLVNLVFPADDSENIDPEALFDFRLNLVLCTANGMAPRSGYNLVTKKTPEYFSHAAAGLVSISGLWIGQDQSPSAQIAAGRVMSPGANVAVFRPFVRYVDASDLVRDLSNALKISDPTKLPVAVDEKGRQFNVIETPQAQAVVMEVADKFFTEYSSQLAFKQPPAFRRGGLKKITFGEAVRLYFHWVLKWLWAAPGEWAQETLAAAKRAIGSQMQELLGNGSQYEVIVQGVSARSVDSVAELDLSLDIQADAQTALSALGVAKMAMPASPFQVWESMVTATCNLADGGMGFNAVPLPSIAGQERLIVVNPDLLSPNSQANYFDVPADLPIAMSGSRLRADDPYSAYVVADQVDQLVNKPGQIDPVQFNKLNQLKLALDKWVVNNRSFVWTIGQKLAQNLNKARVSSREMFLVTANLDSGIDLDAAERSARKSLFKVVVGGLAILGAALVAWGIQALYLFLISRSWPVFSGSWYMPFLFVLLLFFIWNSVGATLFSSKVGEFFDLQRRVQEEKARAKWAGDHIVGVLQELHRLASLYSQYRQWVKIISPMFHREALDINASDGEVSDIKSLSDLPASVVIAELAPSHEARDQLFNLVRDSYFNRGWLKTSLDSYLQMKSVNLNEIWLDNGHGQTSKLKSLASQASDSDDQLLLLELAGASAKSLATQGANYSQWLVKTKSSDFSQEIDGEKFINEIRYGEGEMPSGSILSAKGTVQGAARVSMLNSTFSQDARLEGSTDISNQVALASSTLEMRSLDFMAVRLEVSELTGVDSLSFLSSPVDNSGKEQPLNPRKRVSG